MGLLLAVAAGGCGVPAPSPEEHEVAAGAVEPFDTTTLYPRFDRPESAPVHLLPLAGADTVRLQDNPVDGDDWVAYAVRGLDERLGAWIVNVQYYESIMVLLVHHRTGAELYIPHDIAISPSGTRVIGTAVDLVAGYLWNGLEILRVTPTGFELEYRLDLSTAGWGPSDPEWLADDRIALIRNDLDDTSLQYVNSRVELRFEAGEWRLAGG
jgi:hypothetical protein